ncbi:MAG: hypothetical protein ACYS0H_07280, partial [Planctomycetota bacterium]
MEKPVIPEEQKDWAQPKDDPFRYLASAGPPCPTIGRSIYASGLMRHATRILAVIAGAGLCYL